MILNKRFKPFAMFYFNFLVTQDRAKIQVKRRPPTRQARRAAAVTASASDVTLFGSTPSDEASASARVSWPGDFLSSEKLEHTEVDSGLRPPRTGTKDSDMSDEFFGFVGSSSEVKREEETGLLPSFDDPLAENVFAAPALKPKASKANELFSDESEIFSFSSDKNEKRPGIVSNSKIATDEDDLLSVSKAKEESKTKVSDPLGSKDLFNPATNGNEDIFSFGSQEKKLEPSEKETSSKSIETKISSPLDNDELFSSDRKDDTKIEKTTATKPSKTEVKPAAKDKAPNSDENLFSSSTAKSESKPDKKEVEKPSKSNAVSSPLGEDDDLFTVSTPAKKDIKSALDSAPKKTASPLSAKKTTPKATSILDVSIFIICLSTGVGVSRVVRVREKLLSLSHPFHVNRYHPPAHTFTPCAHVSIVE